ncbi:MAG: TlpA family protein disulfide reductase [Chitinophagaceae bacterium]|nr:TlpA family protein disulfide reductase [Chitinophagaceae bacterium]
MLAEGVKAHELDLKDASGQIFQLRSQQGKVVLLNFTFNNCPHCIESIGMLNMLHSKYGKYNLIIATINPFDTKDAIEKHNSMFKINFPVL